jgi:hypothetical protein
MSMIIEIIIQFFTETMPYLVLYFFFKRKCPICRKKMEIADKKKHIQTCNNCQKSWIIEKENLKEIEFTKAKLA